MDGGEGRRVGSDLRGTTAIPSFSACAPATIPGCLGPAGECCEFHGVPAAGFGDLPPRHGGHEAGACNAVLFPAPPINTSNFQPRVTPMNPIFFRFDKSRKEREIYLIISLQGLIRRIYHWGQDERIIPFDLSETSLLPLLLENLHLETVSSRRGIPFN